MQEPSFLGKFILVSIWFRIDLTQTRVYEDFLALTDPPKYHNLSDITILVPTIKFFDTIVDVDYFPLTYTQNQHWNLEHTIVKCYIIMQHEEI
jgi:hypothetical protein